MNVTEITLITGNRPRSRQAAAASLARQNGSSCMPVSARHSLGGASTKPHAEWHGVIQRGASVPVVAELLAEMAVESTIAEIEESDSAVLAEVICVVEAASFFDDLLDDEYYAVEASRPTLYVARALRMIQHIEHASALLVTEWQSCDTRDLSILLAMLSHLAPSARIRLSQTQTEAPPTSWSEFNHQPGWVQVLNSEHHPHMTDVRVSAFRYEQIRPFHPGRLHDFLDRQMGRGAFGAVVRSAGFCRLATRPGIVGGWEHVGQMISLEPLARDVPSESPLSVGQEIAFIGLDLDAAALSAALDRATLTDAELTSGPKHWSRFADPFPRWA